MAVIESWFEQDLKKPVKVQLIKGNLFSADNQGNLIGVEVFDNGSPATIAGTVSANIIRADGGTVAAIGSYTGNKVSVILPAAAYAITGNETIIIKLTNSGVVTTLLAVVVTVYRSTTDVVVDPGTVLPSIQTLISNIQTAVASIPADYSSLWTTLAPAYSTSSTYNVGNYVTYNGKLYRCNTAISTAEAWTSGHWTETKISTELFDLKSAVTIDESAIKANDETLIKNTKKYYNVLPGVYGYIRATAYQSYNPGDVIPTSGVYGCYTDFIPLNGITKVGCHAKGLGNVAVIAFYKSDKTYLSCIVGTNRDNYRDYSSSVPTNAKYVRFSSFAQADSNNDDFYCYVAGAHDFDVGDKVVSVENDMLKRTAVPRKLVLCVSTYRDDVRTGTDDYRYAVSWDGRSFYEIKASENFASTGLVSSDVQPFEINGGLLMLCTAGSSSSPMYDFKATFTDDFETYYSANVNLGFMEKAATYMTSENPYVWSPQIVNILGNYYIIASISVADSVMGDTYLATVKTRYLKPFAIKVNVSCDSINGLQITAAGEMFQLAFSNDTASVMDVSLFYSSAMEKVYCAYKDRIYEYVNIAQADSITDTFVDFDTYVGNLAYSESGYLVSIGSKSFVYWCDYGYANLNKRKSLLYGRESTNVIEDVGCVNGEHFYADGSPMGMRNPYPIEMSLELQDKFCKKYNVPSIIPEYTEYTRKNVRSREIGSIMSEVVYDHIGKYTLYPENCYYPESATKTVDGQTVNRKICVMNEPAIVKINKAGETLIKTPYGTVTVTKETDTEQLFLIRQGKACLLESNITGS